MKPTLVQYDAPGLGRGRALARRGRTCLPQRAAAPTASEPAQSRLRRGSDADRPFAGVFRGRRSFVRTTCRCALDADGFYADCARALLTVPRGEVVTYGELAALAGYPGAARAAGTFCARCDLAPFLPVHRVVSANGLGSWGELGVAYKKRLLELEHVTL